MITAKAIYNLSIFMYLLNLNYCCYLLIYKYIYIKYHELVKCNQIFFCSNKWSAIGIMCSKIYFTSWNYTTWSFRQKTTAVN